MTATHVESALLDHAGRHHKPAAIESPLSGLNVLLAEDNADTVFMVQEYLGAGVKLEIASNGREAVDKFVVGKFNIVVMDLRMPEMDGLQATRLIRQWEQRHQKEPTPILAYTAHTNATHLSLQADCTGHLIKTASKDVLLSAIAKYAKRSG